MFHQETPNQKNQVCKTKRLETYLPLNSLLNHSSNTRRRIQSCRHSQKPAKKPVDAWRTRCVEAPKTYAKSNQKLTKGRTGNLLGQAMIMIFLCINLYLFVLVLKLPV